MLNTPLKWIISLVFGYLVGQSSFVVFNPILSALLGINDATLGTVERSTIDQMLLWSSMLSLVSGIATVIYLSRNDTIYRLAGKGCVLVGITVLLGLVTTLAPLLIDIILGTSTDNQVMFWSVVFGLPFLIAGTALTVVGKLMLRKDRTIRAKLSKISHD